MLDVHGWGGLQPDLQALVRERRWAELPGAVPDDVVDAFVVSGTPREVAMRLGTRRTGVDRLALSLFASLEAKLELLEALR